MHELHELFPHLQIFFLFAFSWQGQQCTFTALPQGRINSPAPLVRRDLNHLTLPQTITLAHHVDGTVLIGPHEQAVATTLDLLIKHLCTSEDGN